MYEKRTFPFFELGQTWQLCKRYKLKTERPRHRNICHDPTHSEIPVTLQPNLSTFTNNDYFQPCIDKLRATALPSSARSFPNHLGAMTGQETKYIHLPLEKRSDSVLLLLKMVEPRRSGRLEGGSQIGLNHWVCQSGSDVLSTNSQPSNRCGESSRQA